MLKSLHKALHLPKTIFQRSLYTRPILYSQSESKESHQQKVELTGWVHNIRRHKSRTFIDFVDGTKTKPLQIVADSSLCTHVTHGACIRVSGALVPSRHQSLELTASSLDLLGSCPPDVYTLSSPRSGVDPSVARHAALHLRHRLPEYAAIVRLRAGLKSAIRTTMQQRDYLEIDTPIITGADCEGAGETFRLMTGDFFSDVETHLTVSAQLHLEVASAGLGKVYTLSPTFRADKSRTRHHLSEFYMLEAESPHLTSVDAICTELETSIRSFVNLLLAAPSTQDDLDLVRSSHLADSDVTHSLLSTAPFSRLTFHQALQILQEEASSSQNRLDGEPVLADATDLTKRQEHFLASIFSNHRPLFVTDFPAVVKPFYCFHSTDDVTAASVDLLLPGVGEVAGGSVREHRTEVLEARMARCGLLDDTKKSLEWYLDLRRFGGCPHGGYGLGLDRLLQWITGVENARDVVWAPRSYHNCLM